MNPKARPLPIKESSGKDRSPSGTKSAAGDRHGSQQVLNLRLLVGTLVALVVLVPAAHFWHRYQVNRNAAAFLERADTYEAEEEWRSAADYLYRYLRLRPDDARVQVRLAKTFDESADSIREKRRAVQLYFRALGRSPNDPDLHRRQAELLFELNRPAEAQEHADRLLAIDPGNPTGARVHALALLAQARSGAPVSFTKVAEALEKAVQHNPNDLPLATQLASIYRDELRESDRAVAVIDRMVQANPNNAEAYLTRYELQQADSDLDRALDLAPANLEVLLAAGQRAKQRGKLEEARSYYETATKEYPEDQRTFLALGQVYAAEGPSEKAIQTYEKGIGASEVADSLSDTSKLALKLQLINERIGRGGPEDLEEADKRLAELKKLVDRLPPNVPSQHRTQLRSSLDFLRARWLLAQQDSRRAVPLLEQVLAAQGALPGAQQNADQHFQACYLLGSSYAALKQWDKAASAFERAAALESSRALPRLAAAEAWESAGRFEEAIRSYEQGLPLQGAPQAALVALARAHFRQQIARPEGQRNWEPFQQALVKAQQILPDSVPLKLLESEFVAAQGDPGLSIQLLEAAEADNPEAEGILQNLVLAYERAGRTDDAERALERFERVSNNPATAPLLRVELLARRQQFDEAHELLHSRLDTIPDKQKPTLAYRSAQLQLQAGRIPEARKELAALAEKHPDNLPLIQQVADLALQARDFGALERLEGRLRDLEGEDGSLWRYFRAQRLNAQADSVDDARFRQALHLQTEIERLRPSWSFSYLLKGLLAQRRGALDEAIEAYRTAIRYGQRKLGLFERLIALLYQQRRFDEAEQYLALLGEPSSLSQGLSSLAISLADQKEQFDRAIELAHEASRLRPEDPVPHLLLGRTFLRAGRSEDAEAAFRRAARLAPEKAQTWSTLLEVLASQKQTDAVRKLFDEIARAPLPEEQRELLLGHGHDLVGDGEQAETHFREAVRLAPDNAAVQQRAAAFFLRTDPGQAEESLTRVLELSPGSGAARRTLALIEATRGGEEEWQQALEKLPADEDSEPADRRLRAVLLYRRGGAEYREEARRLLEDLVRDPKTASPADRLLLAELYEGQGRHQRAREQLLALVSVENPQPAHLAAYTELLIREAQNSDGPQREADRWLREADRWLKQIEELEPEGFRPLRLRAFWLKERGRSSEIAPLVEAFVEKNLQAAQNNAQKAALFLNAANLYAAVDELAAAERWYRKLQPLSPAAYRPFAEWLMQQGRDAEAVGLCVEAAKSDASSTAAIFLASLLTRGHPSPEEYALAEPVLQQAIELHGQDTTLLVALATLRYKQQRTDDAVRLYKQTLEAEPQHVVALNNLAWLLSEQPDRREEALEYIDRAIRIAGRKAELLDTRGMILFYLERFDDAVEVLAEAAGDPAATSRHLFHLALAFDQTGASDEARKNLLKARAKDLSSQQLTAREQELLADLEERLGLQSRRSAAAPGNVTS